MQMDGIKVFTATKASERNALGEVATRWLKEQNEKPGFEVIDKIVTQSSDSEFHCIAITLFYQWNDVGLRRGAR
jgi:hypothetical protein